jgi:GntR family transcriptional regulator, transcriptional repressor for pyruvate dehydrogenase complex
MPFETIRKRSAPEMVAEQILKQLGDGDLTPGSQLPPQRDLAVLLGVGRSSVREAINALVVMGYLEVHQGSGTFIRKDLPGDDPSTAKLKAALEAGSIFDLMEARESLECKSATLAADRAGGDHLRRLKQTLKEVEESEEDYDSFLRADLRFHACLAEATENVVICEMTRLIRAKVIAHHARLRTTMLSSGYRKVSIRTAREVIRSVEKGDGPGAARWMAEHLNAIRSELKHIVS